MSLNLQEKISVAEALQWLKNSKDYMQGVGEEEPQEEALTSLRPKDFKVPRKARVSKKASAEARSAMPYDEVKCDARVWIAETRAGAQCTRKKADGCGCFCKGHRKDADEHGSIRNGLYTEERPTHPYGDADKYPKPIAWHDTAAGAARLKKKGMKNSSEGKDSSDKTPLSLQEQIEALQKQQAEMQKQQVNLCDAMRSLID